MKIALIGRSEILFETGIKLLERGYDIRLIVTAREAPEYTKTSEDFKKLAQKVGCPYIYSSAIHKQADKLKAAGPIDIGVSYNYVGIISSSVINEFRLGILNAHGGDLPRYRGNACQAWAILQGESRIGLCVHKMIGGELDSGDIIERDYLSIDLNTRIGQVSTWMNQRIPQMYLSALERLKSDEGYALETQSENAEDALRCYPRKPKDGRIDWNSDAESIIRLINASSEPYTGAFCFFDDQKVTVWRASLAPFENFLAVPGQVTAITDDYIEVAAGKGKVRLTRIECGGQSLAPRELASSIRQRFR